MVHSMPLLTDADIVQESLNSTLFPGISSDIEVHSGFKGAQEKYVTLRMSRQSF